MTAVQHDDYELEQISMIAGGDSVSRLWYRIRRVAGKHKYRVGCVRTSDEIASAIALYERCGIETGP